MRPHPTGLALAAAIALFAAGCGDDPARGTLEDRFRALLDEDARAGELPRSRVHPGLLRSAHPVQLHRMLHWVKASGGEFEGVAPGGFEPATRALGDASAEGGDATFRFEKSPFRLRVLFVDDRLAHLELLDGIQGRGVAEHLSRAPDDRNLRDSFAETGKDFWARALMGAEGRAFAMLHPGLQQSLPGPEVLTPAPGVPRGDEVVEIAYAGARPDPQHLGKLHLRYRVRSVDQEVPAHVTLQFQGLQVYLVGFQLPSQLPEVPRPSAPPPRPPDEGGP